MADLSIYKVNLDTPQPNGKQGESPRNAFTKYNSLVDKLDDKYLDKDNNLSELSSKSSARTNLGLGTAATKDVGTSSGNVMEVGAFGWGRSGIGENYPNFTYLPSVTGLYRGTRSTNPELPHLSLGGGGSYHTVLAARISGSSCTYLLLPSANNPLFRGYTDGTTLAWSQLLDSTNLGTSGKKIFYAEDLYEVATSIGGSPKIGKLAGGPGTGAAYFAAVGISALENQTGIFNAAFGHRALMNCTSGAENTAVGAEVGQNLIDFDNCVLLGRRAEVTGSNQVQLGRSTTTVYAYGSVQDRSDIRDKADIRDTTLGLNFINELRPVDYRWDMREDYRPDEPEYPAEPELEDFMPAPVDEASFGDNEQALEAALQSYEQAKQQAELDFEQAYDAWKLACKPIREQWLEDCKLGNIVTDGTHKRNRYHHGLIAQEVKDVLDNLGVDFGGYQDHSINGGDDVLSIGYQELIAPMIKAIQELSARVEQLEGQNE